MCKVWRLSRCSDKCCVLPDVCFFSSFIWKLVFKPLICHIYCKTSAAGYSHLWMTPRSSNLFNEMPVIPSVVMFNSRLLCKHHNLIKLTFKELLCSSWDQPLWLTSAFMSSCLGERSRRSCCSEPAGVWCSVNVLRWIFQTLVSRSSPSLICEPTLNYAATPAESPNCKSSFETRENIFKLSN